MSYSQDIYQKANKILDKRKEDAFLNAQLKTQEIAKKLPELDDIQTKLSQLGLSISRIFLEGGDKKAEIDAISTESIRLQQLKDKLLKNNGFNPDDLKVKYTCETCKDTGFFNEKMCQCQRQLLKDLERAELKKIVPLENSTFETFNTNYYPETSMENGVSPRRKAELIKEQCQKYATTFTSKSPSIMFMGGTGLGKTHISLAIANVVINRGYSVTYGTAQNILNDLEAAHFGKNVDTQYNERQILYSDLLIIDDLGTEFTTQFSVSSIYNIINTRLLAGRPTIISTNYGFDQMEQKYDQRITSRISGCYSTLVFEGNDIRYIK